jgi:uncharacterized membrane protein HdeD (DUF308 family)
MRNYENFWVVTLIRGILAVLIGSAILVVPDMTRTVLILPFGIAFVILSLATYGAADSVLVFVTSFFASLRPARAVLRLQSACGFVIGILFCSIFFDRIQLGWFLYLIAAQALATAYAEFSMARHTAKEHGSRWNYTAASIALVCALSYLIAGICAPANLAPHDIAMLAYAYLAAFGVAQSLMAGRMLAFERGANTMVRGGGQ